MQPTLDGEAVSGTEPLHDVVYGPGVVVQTLTEARFRVYFAASGRTVTYDSLGVSYKLGVRTLYWKNPIVVIPPKSDAKWGLILALLNDISARVRAWRG
jgi:hypothetical protein